MCANEYDIEKCRTELQHGLNTTINAWVRRMKEKHGCREWVTDRQISVVLARLEKILQDRRN